MIKQAGIKKNKTYDNGFKNYKNGVKQKNKGYIKNRAVQVKTNV